MSAREIPTNSGLPPLKLPPAALSPSDRQYSHNPKNERSAIEPIEHKLRVDMMTAGHPDTIRILLDKYSHYRAGPGDQDPWERENKQKPLAVEYAERTIQSHWESEQRFFDNFESDTALDDAPAYLAEQLRNCREKDDPTHAVEKEREKRKKWYELMPWKNLYPIFKKSSIGELLRSDEYTGDTFDVPHGVSPSLTTYRGVLVVDNDVDKEDAASEYGVDPIFVRREREFETHRSSDSKLPTPTDFGIELPAPLLEVQYPSGSEYLLIPWSSGLVCPGPFKQGKPYRVACKHEVLAAFVLSTRDDIFLPIDEGISVPARARRFIDPAIALNHKPEL